jgi:hypothetical protein
MLCDDARKHCRSFLERQPDILLCQRNLRAFGGSEIVELIVSHPLFEWCFIWETMQEHGQPPGNTRCSPHAPQGHVGVAVVIASFPALISLGESSRQIECHPIPTARFKSTTRRTVASEMFFNGLA